MAELEKLKSDEGLKREIEFETKLRDLLAEYNFSLKNIITLLDPQSASRGIQKQPEQKPKQTRRLRSMKVYKNPHSGEFVQTKGGNHKTLKSWEAEYGAQKVDSWLQ